MSTNVPVTTWQPADGNGEFSSGSANNVVDTLSNQLVDTLGNNIVDTGVVFTSMPATVWSEDDGQ